MAAADDGRSLLEEARSDARLETLQARAKQWAAGDPDRATQAEALAMAARGDLAELEPTFGSALEFGTAGLRGLLGPGPARMNRAVVIRTTWALAQHLAASMPDARQRGVVLGYDARHMSRTFAEDAAGVLSAAGFRALVFPAYAATPLVAFAVTHFQAAGGVVVTASHNPAGYNGFKVYRSSGSQIVAPEDSEIATIIESAPTATAIACHSWHNRPAHALIRLIDESVEAAYLEGIGRLLRAPGVRPDLVIVYTPLHGVGYPIARRALAAAGFAKVRPVPAQVEPDPAFPTAPFPNPEEPGVLDLATALAREAGADLVLANDPDADRLAVAVPCGDGSFVQLTGNQVGVLLGHHLLTEGPGGERRAVLATIVSSPMLGVVARSLGVDYEETLTGFKWIASRAAALEREGRHVVYGYEEALGYAALDLVKDKDGISAAVLFAELAAVCKARGTTILGRLESLYRTFGFYASAQRSIALGDQPGGTAARDAMGALRKSPPLQLGNRAVRASRDHAAGGAGASSGAGGLPSSNVLVYELEGDTRVVVRPSGTEPKLKVYLDHRELLGEGQPLAEAEARAMREIARVADDLVRRLQGASARGREIEAARRETARIAIWAVGWIIFARGLPLLLDGVTKGALPALLGPPVYGMLCQIVTLLVGVGAGLALFERPAAVLGIRRLSMRHAAMLVSVLPALIVVVGLLSVAIAVPFFRVHGDAAVGAARQHAGGFGRAVAEAPLPLLLLWAGIIPAVTEELMFRGALFRAVQRVVSGSRAGAGSREGGDRLANATAVIVAAVVFGALHANWAGTVGVVRVASATLFGLASGVAVLLTGTVVAPMLMHFLLNTLVVCVGRGWFDGPSKSPGLPSRLLVVAALGLAWTIAIACRPRLMVRDHEPPARKRR